MLKFGALSLPLVFGTACATTASTEKPRAFVQAEPQTKADQKSEPEDARVVVDEDIRKACGINSVEAFFAYRSATVSSGDKDLLAKLATCFTSGALAARSMSLVGHADPRGDDEYNYVLGQSRADNLKSAIVKAGLPSAQVLTVSRGEHEARGVDEATWVRDRRVDITLIK